MLNKVQNPRSEFSRVSRVFMGKSTKIIFLIKLLLLIEQHPDKFNVYYFMSINPNISWDKIESNLSKDWNYSYLSINKFTFMYEKSL